MFFTKLRTLRHILKAKKIIQQTVDRYGEKSTALAWTGGKDSTLLLWLVREVCIEKNTSLPQIVFIDEGDLFPEILQFSKKLISDWSLDVTFVQNTDVMKQVKKLGDAVSVAKLSQQNQEALKELGFKKKSFLFEPESLVGNHLMKTVALNTYIRRQKISALMTGIRKDEQEARSKETYFSERKNPQHTRVHPLLDFTEKDVWNVILQKHVPYSSLYKKGYRSLGAKSSTRQTSSLPAWKQDLRNTPERGGRRQDKEKIMEKLRKLGYM